MATTHVRREELIDLTPEDEKILDRVWAKFRRNHPNYQPSPEYIAELKRGLELQKNRVRPPDIEKRFAELRHHPHEVRH